MKRDDDARVDVRGPTVDRFSSQSVVAVCDDVERSRRVRERTREMRERELLGAVWVRSEWSEERRGRKRSEERSGVDPRKKSESNCGA